MSLGSIPRQRKVSDAQFVGDLMGLLNRHRIESAEAGGLAQFESYLASKDTFRSQLFTLCTAISHMADEDLSGEELLGLIGRAMGVSDGDQAAEIPDSMRSAFLAGYASWINRALNEQDVWPPERKPMPANEPIPFPQPIEALPEPEHGLRVPGLPTVQEALLMAKKQAPFELPLRGSTLPAAQPAGSVSMQPGGNITQLSVSTSSPVAGGRVENLTISELTQLLEDIERRMSRIKPHVHELSALIHPPTERLDRSARPHDGDATRTAAIGPALVTQRVDVTLSPLDAAFSTTQDVENDPFVARHAYLNPKNRRHSPLAPPASSIVAPASPPPPMLEAVAVPADASVAAAPAEAAQMSIFPRSANAVITRYKNIDAAIAFQPDSYRVLVHIAIGVLAAVILVAIPLAAVMVYRSSQIRYEYHDLQPAAPPAPSTTAVAPKAPGASSQPASNAAGSQTAVPAGAAKAKNRPGKRKSLPPVEVWPPPPSR